MKKVLLFGLITTTCVLMGCTDHQPVKTIHAQSKGVGPLQICPNDSQLSYFRKSGRQLNTYDNCFNDDVGQLLKQNKMKAYVRWLTMTKQFELAEIELLKAVNIGDDDNEWFTELVNLNVKQKNWNQAQYYLNQSQIGKGDHLRLVVEARTGEFSDGIDYGKVPAIFEASTFYPGKKAKQAVVKSGQSAGFVLTKVDDALPGVLAGESSMSVSQDGQKAWLLWTESSGQIDPVTNFTFWRLNSARTFDGGNNWQNEAFSIRPENQSLYHFDPMTTYDSNNDLMYAGGLITQFEQPFFNSYYLKRWDLATDIIAGPFETEGRLDKDWLAVNQSGEVIMVDGLINQNMRVSVDQAQSFQEVSHGGGFLFPQPEYDLNDCLHIIGFLDFLRCDEQGGFETVVAPNTSFGLNLDTVLPGTFRAVAARLIGFHPNGDAFIIYPDLKTPQSDQVVLWMSRSMDGTNWQTPWIISPDLPGDRFLPWLEIDITGGIHVSYADTRNHVIPDDAPNPGIDMYYSYSDDLGESWQETRITPTTLMIPELIWGDYFFSDYFEMSVGNPDAVFMSFSWFDGTGDMDMYVAKKITDDLIFMNGFE